MLRWSKEETLKLVKLYKERPLLYDFNSSEYRNKVARLTALMEIQNEMRTIIPSITVPHIRRKIKNLRHSYKNWKSANKRFALCNSKCLTFLDPFVNEKSNRSKTSKSDFESENTIYLLSDSEEDYDNELLEPLKPKVNHLELDAEIENNCIESVNGNSTQVFNQQIKDNESSGFYDSYEVRKGNDEEDEEDEEEETVYQQQQFANNQLPSLKTCQTTGRNEELFCNFLCDQLKKINSNDEYEDVQWKILDLVKLSIKKEKILQAYSRSGNSNSNISQGQITYHQQQ